MQSIMPQGSEKKMTEKRKNIDLNLSVFEDEEFGSEAGKATNQRQKKRRYQRHSTDQIKRLEE